MAKAFTTWVDLKQDMKNDLASGAWRTMSGYGLPDGRSVQYRSFKEFQELLNYVETQADIEAGASSYYGRTRVGNGGRG